VIGGVRHASHKQECRASRDESRRGGAKLCGTIGRQSNNSFNLITDGS
jgi:hypothetical protein